MAKKFFYVCGGLLMLALAYHFGATSATAQIAGRPTTALAYNGSTGQMVALSDLGDVYVSASGGNMTTWHYEANVFSGGPVQATQPSWGQLKARYR